MRTVQAARPVQAPFHPAKKAPVPGFGVNCTLVPEAKEAVQVEPQLMPAGLLVTVPVLVPASVTVTVYVVGGAEAGNGERPGPMALAKVAAKRFAANIARGTICGQSGFRIVAPFIFETLYFVADVGLLVVEEISYPSMSEMAWLQQLTWPHKTLIAHTQ